MRSKTAQRILDNTPQAVKDKVSEYANKLVAMGKEKYFKCVEIDPMNLPEGDVIAINKHSDKLVGYLKRSSMHGVYCEDENTLLPEVTHYLREFTPDEVSGEMAEFKELFYQMGEDWHLWQEEEKGIYPIQRVFDAMKKFIDSNSLTNK